MKKIDLGILCILVIGMASVFLSNTCEADGRVITENGTNIFAIGIDSRDFSVIRFYLQDNKTLEIRTDELLHGERRILPPVPSPAVLAERVAILNDLKSRTNAIDFTALSLPTIVSNLTRLQQIEDRIAEGRTR